PFVSHRIRLDDNGMANPQMTKRATQRAADNSDSVIHSSLDEGLISTPEQVGELISHIDPHDRVAIDTEADSLHCYREKLCLLQISIPGHDDIVDPLADVDLAPLQDALSNKEIVLHGADYDLRLLRRNLNFVPERIFDTVI